MSDESIRRQRARFAKEHLNRRMSARPNPDDNEGYTSPWKPEPPAKSRRVVAVLEDSSMDRPVMDTIVDYATVLRSHIGRRAHEFLIAMYIDSDAKYIGHSEFTTGDMTQVSVDLGGIYREALICGASGIVIAHQHPGGIAMPSKADLQFAEAMSMIGSVIHIPLIDSIIIAPDGVFSIRMNQTEGTGPITWKQMGLTPP